MTTAQTSDPFTILADEQMLADTIVALEEHGFVVIRIVGSRATASTQQVLQLSVVHCGGGTLLGARTRSSHRRCRGVCEPRNRDAIRRSAFTLPNSARSPLPSGLHSFSSASVTEMGR